jgi:tetratricopeptide (TPR) repeat protein
MAFSKLRHRTAFSILCCTLSLFPPACVAAPVGKVQIYFARGSGPGDYLISQGSNLNNPGDCGYLVSIDGADLSKLSDFEIDKMLYGQIGTIKSFTFLDVPLNLHQVQRECCPISETIKSIHSLPLSYHYLDCRTADKNASVITSADIYTKAVHNLIAQKGDELNVFGYGQTSADIASHAFICYQMGDLDGGDRLLALSRQAAKGGGAWNVLPHNHVAQTLSLLFAVGRPKMAVDLFEGIYIDGKPDAFRSEAAYIMALYFVERADKARALSVLDAIVESRQYQLSPTWWIGDLYLRLGALTKAKQAYDKSIDMSYQHSKQSWPVSVQLRQLLVGKAQVQFAEGDKKAAKNTLVQAIELSKRDCSPKILAAIDMMPHKHPHLRDIQNAIGTIDTAKQFPSSIASATMWVSPAPLPTEAALKAIKAGNETAAGKAANELLDRYSHLNRFTGDQSSSYMPNIYCHLMHVARKAKDRGWTALSNQILKALKNEARGLDAAPSVKEILQTELAYNGAEPLNARGLRELALTYYYAGELPRAKWLIDKALADKSSNLTMSRLDAACIAARQRDFVTAGHFWKEICKDNAPRSLAFFGTTRELCMQYTSAGKTEDAIKILKAAIIMPEEITRFKRGRYEANTDLQFLLAKLLLDQGKYADAYAMAKDIGEAKEPMLWYHFLILAHCAVAVGDYKTAADTYLLLTQHHSRVSINESLFLQKALEWADKVPNYDRAKTADICYRLSCMDLGQPDKRLQYAERAYKLMPESDPRKARMIGAPDSLRHPNPSKPSLGMSERDKIRAQAARQLPPVVEAAKMAERNNQQQAHEMWLKAAVIAAFARDPIRSELYARNALRCYSSQMYPLGQGVNILDRLLVLGYTDVAVRVLKAAIGRSRWVDGVKSNNLQNLYADGFSFYLALNRKDMASRMLDGALTCDMTTGPTRQQYISVSHCSPTPPNAVSVIKQILGALPDHELGKFSNNNWTKPASDDAFVLSSLQKILAAQKAALAPQDERMMPTLCALGYFYHRRKEYEKAQKFYDEAALMELNYQNHKDAGRALGKYFVENLKKVGRDKEAVLYGAQ